MIKSFFGNRLVFELANPKTLWWTKNYKGQFHLRKDYLLSLNRTYCREVRGYLYSLIIFRLKITYLGFSYGR
jgi:hypothetical protein